MKNLVHRFKKTLFHKAFFWSILILGVLGVEKVYAQGGGGVGGSGSTGGGLTNPLRANSLVELLQEFVRVVVMIAIPVAAVFIIYAGFLFVTAGGNEQKIASAKKTFFWTIIGVIILLGAGIIIQVITETVGELSSS